MKTKDRILEEALTLFSQRGYDGTGVDLIAERVGIKGPSLYKHFKGKEDILNALIEAAETRYNNVFGSEERIGDIPKSKDEFITKSMERIAFTMRDPMIRRMRMFLVQEQFRNERLSELTTRHQTIGVRKMYEKIIDNMMKNGLFKKENPTMLALELVSPAVLMIAQADRQPQHEKEILIDLEKFIRHFCDVHMVG